MMSIKNKTVYFQQEDLYPNVLRQLEEGKIQPHDISFAMRSGYTNHFQFTKSTLNQYREKFKKGFAGVFLYNYTKHLIIYSK